MALRGIAKAAPQIEAEQPPGHRAGAVGPIPLVVIRPYAAAPVQKAEGVLAKRVCPPFIYGPAARRHAVYLLVIVEHAGRFLERGLDDGRKRHGVFQRDGGLKIRCGKREKARVSLRLEAQVHTLFIISDIAVLLGIFRQMQAAERKGNELADVRYHLALFEIKQHDAHLPGIRGMTECELQAFLSIGNLIKVPLLNAQRRGLDVCTGGMSAQPGAPTPVG